MSSNNVEKKIADLIQAFRERKVLSINDIGKLLSKGRPSRQTAYNYIEHLAERGFKLESEKEGRVTYYKLVSDPNEAPRIHYIPLNDKALRTYCIVQQIQKYPVYQKNLEKRFLFSSSDKPDKDLPYEDDKIPIDLRYSAFRNLVQELEQKKEIQLTNGVYRATGRNIPILHRFTSKELLELLQRLKTLPDASPYHGQLESIAQKLDVLKVSCNLDPISNPSYLTYGKNHEMLEQISQWMKKLSDSNYTEKMIQVTYKTRSGETLTVLFQTGMVIYTVEKAKLYLLGKEYNSDPVLSVKYHTVIDVSSIIRIETTDYANTGYQSEEYKRIYSEMFSISLEDPMQVVIRFDLVANVRRKIQYLKQQRSHASITYFPEENQLEYRDTIRGLSDFANYLRQFGRSVRVIAPAVLKEKMSFSVDRALKRYEEDDHE